MQTTRLISDLFSFLFDAIFLCDSRDVHEPEVDECSQRIVVTYHETHHAGGHKIWDAIKAPVRFI
jgi:hypothetical protein